ncbi:MAG: molybdopterin-dependent oxidoreductase [Flavobacteriales bacterium]
MLLRSAFAMLHLVPLVGASQNDTLTVRVHHSGGDARVTFGEMRTLTQRTATIASHDGVEAAYEGAWLMDILKMNSASIAAIEKRTMVRSYVRVEAADGYNAIIALAETDTSFRQRPVILAWKKNGQPLDNHDGPFQLIVPDDMRHARDVRQVTVLEVITP